MLGRGLAPADVRSRRGVLAGRLRRCDHADDAVPRRHRAPLARAIQRCMAKAFAESVGKGLIDAKAAAKFLSVQPRTLYAYVSRGLVRSVPGARGRPRLYATADLERLKARRDARSGHAPVAAGALRWGEPVLDSAVTAITPQGPAYRGRLATELAASGTRFENVAELLWSGYLPVEPIVWPHGAVPVAALAKLVTVGARPLDVMPLIVQVAALGDPGRGDRRPDAIISRGRQLIPLLAAALAPDFSAAAVTRARRRTDQRDLRTRARSRRLHRRCDRCRARRTRRSRAQCIELRGAGRGLDRSRSVCVRLRSARDGLGSEARQRGRRHRAFRRRDRRPRPRQSGGAFAAQDRAHAGWLRASALSRRRSANSAVARGGAQLEQSPRTHARRARRCVRRRW